MESPFLLLMIPLLIGITVAAVWTGTKPIREMRRDPEMSEQLKLPLRERWRYARLARSEQVISDPHEARRARSAARIALTASEHAFSRGKLFYIGIVFVFFGLVRLRADLDLRNLLGAIGLPLLFVVAYLVNRRQERQMRRTAELNGWDLAPNSTHRP